MFDSILGAGNTGVKMGFVDLWFTKIINHLSRYRSNHGTPQTDNLYYSPEFLYSGSNKICAVYIIDSYPEQLPIDFEELIRGTVSGFSTKVNFIQKFDPYSINWNSAKTNSTINNWKTADTEAESLEDDPYKLHDNYSQISNKRRHALSLQYFNEAQRERGVTMFKTRIMMTIAGTRSKAYDDDLKAVEELMKSLGIKITRVEDAIPEYAGYFSPASFYKDKEPDKNVGYYIFTDEILARFNTYRQGQTSGTGMICWGLDVYSGYPVFSDFKKKPTDADNVLIVAETGGGKSFLVKNDLLYLLADDRFILSINDIEGGEYDHLADYIQSNQPLTSSTGIKLNSTVILDLSEGSGRYYDPMELNTSGNTEVDAGAFGTAVMYAKGIFTLITGSQEGDTGTWISNILDNAIGQAYAKRGVTDDPRTWNLSQGMSLRDVYEEVVILYHQDEQKYRDNLVYQNARDLVYASITKYFEGVRRGYFKNRITLKDLVDAKVVICSFGLKSKAEFDEVQLGLAQLYAAAISHLRSIYAKTHGAYNVKVWEEFQRWGTLKGSEPIIRTALTGGRKMGDVNIVITNNVGPILKNDKFGIFESTTSYAISKINSTQTRVSLAKTLGISRMLPDLDAIAGVDSSGAEDIENNPDTPQLNDLYDHAFLVKTATDVSICKAYLPDDIVYSPLFYTAGGGEHPDIHQKKHESLDDLDVTGLLSRANEVLNG